MMADDKQSVTVDAPEFRDAFASAINEEAATHEGYPVSGEARAALIAHIDAHTKGAVARAVAEKDAEIKRLTAALDAQGELTNRYQEIALAAQAAPVAASDAIPQELRDIGELLRTQDNRITDQPMFIVQQRRRITGLDTDFCEKIVWLHSEDEYSEADNDKHNSLEAEYQETGRQPSGWLRTGYSDEWEFVTACFTEQGCKDYLARDGHNLKEPRIYADGSYRNAEFRTVRNWLMSLAAHTQQPAAVPAECSDGGKCGIGGYCDNCHAQPPAGELPVLPDTTQTEQQKCFTCSGHGLIGGLMPGDGGYHSEDCPECGGSGLATRQPAPVADGLARIYGEAAAAETVRSFGEKSHQLGRAAGMEEAAKVCDNADKSAHPSDLAFAIRATIITGSA